MNSYYVYSITDPLTCQPFYIGKGSKKRAWSHTSKDAKSKRVRDKISSIRKRGQEPIVKIIQDQLDEVAAYELEGSLISRYGRKDYDPNGILMNICEDNRPPKKKFQTLETRRKISIGMQGKNKGKTTWNKGKKFSRGSQSRTQTANIMKTRILNLMNRLWSHYETIDDSTIKLSRQQGIIANNSPISEASIIHFFGRAIIRKEDILQ
jgi:hypothetical protein